MVSSATPVKVLVASRNTKKLAELNRVLAANDISGIELLSLNDVPEYPEVPEIAPDFVGNARIKTAAGVHNSGFPTIADDSGICVDALNDMPGILSARWSGGGDAENNALLLHQLSDTLDERRQAYYTCVCVLELPASLAEEYGLEREYVAEGQWHGRILRAEQGEGGFGYDPLFEPAEEPGRSVAELEPGRKDELSHRAKALAQLVVPLRQLSRAVGNR